MNRRPANRGAPPDGVREVSEPDDWDVEGSVALRSPCSCFDTQVLCSLPALRKIFQDIDVVVVVVVYNAMSCINDWQLWSVCESYASHPNLLHNKQSCPSMAGKPEAESKGALMQATTSGLTFLPAHCADIPFLSEHPSCSSSLIVCHPITFLACLQLTVPPFEEALPLGGVKKVIL